MRGLEIAEPKSVSVERNPRVIFVLASAGINSAARSVAHLAQEFERRGVSVQVAVPVTDQYAAISLWLDHQGVRVVPAPPGFGEPGDSGPRGVAGLRDFLRRLGPGVVSLHYSGSQLPVKHVRAVRAAGCRCVASLHGGAPMMDTDQQVQRANLSAARFCSALVVPSAWARAAHTDSSLARRLRVIAPGLRTTEGSGRAFPEEARAALGVPANAFVVAVNVPTAPKGAAANLLECLSANLPDRDSEPAAYFLVAGAPFGVESARVRFVGSKEGAGLLLAAADAFVQGVGPDGEPEVGCIEAALRGVPSVAYRVGAVPEVVVHGETGLLAAPGEASTLAALVAQLRRDPTWRQRLGAAARHRAYCHHTDTAMADAYEPLLFPGRQRRNGVWRRVAWEV